MSEEQKAKKREYYEKNKERITKSKKEHYQNNKEEIQRRKQEYRLRNIEQTKARDKASYDRRRDEILAQKKKVYYETKPPSEQRDWRVIIEKVKKELAYYTSLGIRPTLRTMHYRLYSLGIINNTTGDYGSLSKKTTAAREGRKTNVAGSYGKLQKEYYPRLPINCFADDTRRATRYNSELDRWEPEDVISDMIDDLRTLEFDYYKEYFPRWLNQPHYVEIWTEKKAMVGTFKEIIGNRQVPIVPFGGYHSVPYLWNNANILKDIQKLEYEDEDGIKHNKKIHILYFGDFDPTGEDIERVICDRLRYYGVRDIDFQRIGVTKKQMEDFGLPQDVDAKTEKKLKRDARAKRFIEKYEKLYQIEVDALPAKVPEEFRDMVTKPIDDFFDDDIYDKVLEKYPSEDIHDAVEGAVRERFGLD
jgi:hypothetical protein